MTLREKIKPYLLVLLLMSTVCALAYFNSLHNPFIWDDEGLVVKNTLIRNWQNLPQAFTNDLYFGANSGSNFYRPLQTISYIIDYHFWGLNPFGYHLTNIILQIGVSFLVFLLVANLFTSLAIAIGAGVLFAVSPIHTEAVTYISGRAEMLMGFFIILALLLFMRSQKKAGRYSGLFYILSLLSFVLSLLTKEVAIVFPFIISGYIFYIQRDRLKEKYYFFKRSGPFFALALIYILVRVSSFNFVTFQLPALVQVPWFIRLSVLPKVSLTYLKLLINPTGLHMSWELARPKSYPGILLAVFSLGAIIAACFLCLRQPVRNKSAAFMLFWSLVFFIPQSGIFPINAFIAEHFIYLSSISFFILIAYVLDKFLRKELFIFCIGAICAVYILVTGLRNLEWSNGLVFYQGIIKHSPTSFQAHNNLGLEYERRGFYQEAQREYLLALEIKGDLLEARSNLASAYYRQKRYADALNEYALIEKMPLGNKAGEVQNNIANIYDLQGLKEKAMERYKLALALDARLNFTHFNLARIYFAKNDLPEAVRQICLSLFKDTTVLPKRYLQVISNFIHTCGTVDGAEEFYNNLGIRFANELLWEPAIICFKRSIEIDENFQDAYFNLGLAYLKNGKKNEAVSVLKSCLRINPNHFKAKGLLTSIIHKN